MSKYTLILFVIIIAVITWNTFMKNKVRLTKRSKKLLGVFLDIWVIAAYLCVYWAILSNIWNGEWLPATFWLFLINLDYLRRLNSRLREITNLVQERK